MAKGKNAQYNPKPKVEHKNTKQKKNCKEQDLIGLFPRIENVVKLNKKRQENIFSAKKDLVVGIKHHMCCQSSYNVLHDEEQMPKDVN